VSMTGANSGIEQIGAGIEGRNVETERRGVGRRKRSASINLSPVFHKLLRKGDSHIMGF